MPRRVSNTPRASRRISSAPKAPVVADDLAMINWNVTPTRSHSGERTRSATRADIAGIFMGGLLAGGAASTVDPRVLSEFSEDPPITGGCVDLLWGDFDGLDVIGAQFAVASGGAPDPFDVIDQIVGNAGDYPDDGTDSAIGGVGSDDDSDNGDDDSANSADIADDSADDSGSSDSDDSDIVGGNNDVNNDVNNDGNNDVNNDILGSAVEMLDRLLEEDTLPDGDDSPYDQTRPPYSMEDKSRVVSISNEFRNAALIG